MTYVSPIPPMTHQSTGQARAAPAARRKKPIKTDVMAYRMETGCGKTKVPIDEWQVGVESGRYEAMVVIAPAGSFRNWYEDKIDSVTGKVIQLSELSLHLDPALRKKMLLAPWKGKAAGKQLRAQAVKEKKRPRVTVINVEAFSGTNKALDFVTEFIKNCDVMKDEDGVLRHKVLIVVDESTTIRNEDAKRTAKIFKLRDLCLGRRVLTGLMTPKSPLDVFMQYNFLDPRIIGYESYVAFQARYAKVERACFLPRAMIVDKLRRLIGIDAHGRSTNSPSWLLEKLRQLRDEEKPRVLKSKNDIIDQIMIFLEGADREDMVDAIFRMNSWIQSTLKVKEFQNLEELTEKLAPYSHIVFKKEALPELPDKTYAFWEHELTDEQQKAYDEMLKFSTTEIEKDGHVTAVNVVSRMVRLHQIVMGHSRLDEDGRVVDLPSRRPDEILRMLQDHAGKAIIWSIYPRECEKIAARIREEYGEKSVALFHGQNAKTRGEDERRFLGRDECRFMVSTQMSGGRGNTWNVADLTIYAGNSYDLEWRFQSEDRNHRKGQKAAVKYVDMIVRGTVETRIVSALRQKIDLMSIINGENYRQWLV